VKELGGELLQDVDANTYETKLTQYYSVHWTKISQLTISPSPFSRYCTSRVASQSFKRDIHNAPSASPHYIPPIHLTVIIKLMCLLPIKTSKSTC